MGSRDSELPPFTWEELVAYAQKENLKPLDVGRLIHKRKNPKLKTHVEIFIIYGIIHRQLETIKPKVIKSTNYKWFLRKMPEGTKINMDGRIHTTKAWRTNETFIHFVIAFFESERMLGKMYDEYRKKYNLKPTTNLIKTLTRGYSEAYLDSQKRKLIHQWSIPVDNPPPLKK